MRLERQTGPKDPREGAGWLSLSALGLGWMTLAVPARLPCESSQLWPPVGALHSLEQDGGRAACAWVSAGFSNTSGVPVSWVKP